MQGPQLTGVHLVMDAMATKGLNHRAYVEEWLRRAADLAGLTLLGFQGVHLPSPLDSGPGVSVLAILVESHASVETWPEHGVICMDFYSCKGFDVAAVVDSFRNHFGVTKILQQQAIARFGVAPKTPREDRPWLTPHRL